ncbi:sulfatase [Fulvivirgaceae bacterium BMA10]|uniref:Sulfatase n=1 Tax=Splendidivirga corallicola TaxID=3051826 RepID=A0ABT8KJX2_9BACT|nr:sulfatase [Fulvivirgaceae bacterium BMA10]
MKYIDFLRFATFLMLALLVLGCRESEKVKTRPNILIAIMDDATYAHLGAYGCQWVNTPAFDRVAREGILFSNAYTPNAKCAPSRASILTGRNSWQLEEAANHWCYFPQKFKTYTEALADHGYHVGYTAKGWAPGVVGEINGKKRQLTGQPFNKRKTEAPTTGISGNDYAANFVDFLEARTDNEPFCFWYGSTEPHRRYEYGSGIKKGKKKLQDIEKVYSFWPDNDTVRTDLLDYAYEIEYFDQHLGKMLEVLEERGELKNTLVVVTADNGMPFPRIKGQEYELSNHLPLAIMWQEGIEGSGRVVEDFVSFIDFAPTFTELAGVKPEASGMQAMEGKSLTNIFYTDKSGAVEASRDHVLIGKERHDVGRPHDWGYPIRGIVKGDYLYIHNFEPDRWPAGDPVTGYLNCDGSPTKTVCLNAKQDTTTYAYWQWSFGKRPTEELYFIKDDPECLVNLSEDADHSDLKASLKKQLFAELKQQSDPRILGNGEIFDTYEYANKSNSSFYERFMQGEKLNSGWVNPSDFEK